MYFIYMYCIAMDMNAPTTGSLVWHLALRWRAAVDRTLAPLGMTHAQYSVLASLHALVSRNQIPTQRELADYTKLQAIYVSKLIRALEENGCITRSDDLRDSRAFRLTLTEKGTDIIVSAKALVRDLDGRLTASIGGSHGGAVQQLSATLQTLINAYDESGESRCPPLSPSPN